MSAMKKLIGEKILELEAGKATPAPPVGPALGGLVGNVGALCKDFNARTSHLDGAIVRVVVRAFSDKSYELDVLKSPTTYMIKKELGIKKFASTPGREVVGSLTREQVRKIAEYKASEMISKDIEAAEKQVLGSMRSMGLTLTD